MSGKKDTAKLTKRREPTSDKEAGPSKKARKNRVKSEKTLVNQIKTAKKRLDDLLTEYKDQFEKDYVFETDDSETERPMGATSYTDKYSQRDKHQKRLNDPRSAKPCKVCKCTRKIGFSVSLQLCYGCETQFKRYKIDDDEEKKQKDKEQEDNNTLFCVGVPQMFGMCQADWRLIDCTMCKLKIIQQKFPIYEAKMNLDDSPPPTITQEGHYGYLMDLRQVQLQNYTLDHLPEGHPIPGERGSAALILRCMDFAIESHRRLAFVLIKFELDDPRLESAYGLQQFLKRTKYQCDLRGNNNRKKADGGLVSVEMDLIPWSPDNYSMAVVLLNCFKLTDYLLNPLLNAHQTFQTVTKNLRLDSKSCDLAILNYCLQKRGVTSIDWGANTINSVKRLYKPNISIEKRSGKDRRVNKLKSSENFEGGVVYGYFFADGKTNIGSNHGSTPRDHPLRGPTALTKHKSSNVQENTTYFRCVLFYVEKNEDRVKYESMIQVLFKLAELHGWTLDNTNFPFPETINVSHWTDLKFTDKQPIIPSAPIELLNDKIEEHQMTPATFEEFLNLAKVFFGVELGYPDQYKHEDDPLRFTIEPQIREIPV